MSFSAAGLGLREPYDLRARNAAVIDAVVKWRTERKLAASGDRA